VLWAPFVGEIRAFIRREFPGHLVLVGVIIAAGLSAALLARRLSIHSR